MRDVLLAGKVDESLVEGELGGDASGVELGWRRRQRRERAAGEGAEGVC